MLCHSSTVGVFSKLNSEKSVLKVGYWPVSKSEPTNRNVKQFIRYINSMDLEKIIHSNEEM
jgi:hypothetical protein